MLQESRRIRTSRESLGRSRQRTRSVAAMHLQHEVVFANVVAVVFTQIEEGIIWGVSGDLILWLSRRARKSSLGNSLSVGAAFFSLIPTSPLATAVGCADSMLRATLSLPCFADSRTSLSCHMNLYEE